MGLANNDDPQRIARAILKRLEPLLEKLSPEIFERGFYGDVEIVIKIEDGVIQDSSGNLRQKLKCVERECSPIVNPEQQDI